jgi:McbB family protein
MFNHNSGVPCHFCNFNRHKHVMMANGRMKKSAWLNFCKYTFSQSLDITPSKTLNHAEKGLATFWLTQIVNQVVSSQSRTLFLKEMTQYKWINLINGDIGYEQSVHWPFCECLR